MSTEHNLQRFILAQERDYQTALKEIRSGRKRSHWMWYLFQEMIISGLIMKGLSSNHPPLKFFIPTNALV